MFVLVFSQDEAKCSYSHCSRGGEQTDVCEACGTAPFHYKCARSAAYWEDRLLAPLLCEPCLLQAIVVDKRFSVSSEALRLAQQARHKLGLVDPSCAVQAQDSTFQGPVAGDEQGEHPKPAFDQTLQKRRRKGDLLEGALGSAGGSQDQNLVPFSSSASAPTVGVHTTAGSLPGASSGTQAATQAAIVQQQGTCLSKLVVWQVVLS